MGIAIKEEWDPNEGNWEGFLEEYEAIGEEYEEINRDDKAIIGNFEEDFKLQQIKTEEFLNQYEEITEDIHREENTQTEDFKKFNTKTEPLVQDYPDPLGVCDVKLDDDIGDFQNENGIQVKRKG